MQNRTRRARSASPNLKYQSVREKSTRGNLILTVALCLLLPPVGIVYAWRSELKGVWSRLVPTLAGLGVMTLLFAVIFHTPGSVDAILPSPVVPLPFDYVAPTLVPGPGVSQDELDAAYQNAQQTREEGDTGEAQYDDGQGGENGGIPEGAAPAPVSGPVTDLPAETPAPTPEPTPEPTQGPITVFAVAQNATLYHAYETCDGQLNARELTLEEAKAEGLRPCSKCRPVKYN